MMKKDDEMDMIVKSVRKVLTKDGVNFCDRQKESKRHGWWSDDIKRCCKLSTGLACICTTEYWVCNL